jgi:hypothetical protein
MSTAVLIGSQTPRISSVPDYVSSSGQEAYELAESAGLLLDPWQRLCLEYSLGERPNGRWSAFEVGLIVPRQNGKGSVLEARELFGLFLGGEKLIIHTSHLFSTSLEHFRRLKGLIENTPDLQRQMKPGQSGGFSTPTGSAMIELRNGARLIFKARTKGSGRGLSGDLVVLDEAYELDEFQTEALMPTLLARPNPQLWYTSSPVLDTETGVPLTTMRKRGMKGTDPTLCYLEWSAAAEGAEQIQRALDDPQARAQANPALGMPRPNAPTAEKLDGLRQSMSNAGFAREILCIWPVAAGADWQVVSEADWLASTDDESTALDPVSFAIYVRPDRESTCIAAAGQRADGDLHMTIIELGPRTGWVPARAVELVRRWKPCRLVIDRSGAGASMIIEVDEALKKAKLDLRVTPMNTPEAGAAYGMVYDALTRTGDVPAWRLWHRSDQRLDDAMKCAVTRSLGREGTTWDVIMADGNLAPVATATQAVWGFVTRPPEPVGAWIMRG